MLWLAPPTLFIPGRLASEIRARDFAMRPFAPGDRDVEPTREELTRVASLVWGSVNKAASGAHELRFGTNGSKSLDLENLRWFDHEAMEGGGWAALYRLAKEPMPRDEAPRERRRIAATYPYVDEGGALLMETVRYASGVPRFHQRQPDGVGGWIWNITKPAVRRVLYRLPELLGSDDLVWVCEGEKDVDNLIQAGVCATCNPMGADAGGKGWLEAYSEMLRGRDVALLPDNDEVGRAFMAAVARALAGVARSVRTVVLPGLGDKGDVSDWLNAGHGVDQLFEIYRDTPPYEPIREPPVGRLIDGLDFVAAYEPPDWMIEGVLQHGRLYACTSLTNHGKTAVWLYAACMIQAGRTIAGLAVDQGEVLYLAGENPTDLQGRMVGMMRTFELRALPTVLPKSFPMTPEELEVLKGEILALGRRYSLIVGDTAASFFPGDNEDDNVAAGSYARSLRSLCELPGNPAVLMLAHPVKHAQADNLLPRGGSAFLNELDGNLTLWSEALGETTRLHWQGKIRGPDFEAINFKYRVVSTGKTGKNGKPDMTVVAEPIDDFEAVNLAKQNTQNEDAVLTHLKRDPNASLAQIARACGWINEAGEPLKAKAQRTVANLKKLNLIKSFRGKLTLTKAGEAVLDQTDTIPDTTGC